MSSPPVELRLSKDIRISMRIFMENSAARSTNGNEEHVGFHVVFYSDIRTRDKSGCIAR